jgi:hypothetical protein
VNWTSVPLQTGALDVQLQSGALTSTDPEQLFEQPLLVALRVTV